MSGLMSRNKGKRFEREVAARFRTIYGDKVKRGWQTRAGSKDAPDVCGTPFAIECKHQARPNVFAAYEQACEAARHNGGIPLAVVKKNRGEALAVIELGYLLGILDDVPEGWLYLPKVKPYTECLADRLA